MRLFKKNKIRRFEDYFYYVSVLIIISIVSSQFFFRIDLSKDKRYTLSPQTKLFLKGLNQNINITIYLEGNLPHDFEKLRSSIKEKLLEFKEINKKLIFKFENIDSYNESKRIMIFDKFNNNRIVAKTVFIKNRGKEIKKSIFPIAKINNLNNETFINLYEYELNDLNSLKKSIQNIEYSLVKGIEIVLNKMHKRIAFINQIGEPHKNQLLMLFRTIEKYYEVVTLPLQKDISLNGYDALIIAKPTIRFTEEQKYLLDQYIMNGGKVLFFIDGVKINKNNLFKGVDFALNLDLNLNDMFFKYGVRINSDLIQDSISSHIPVVVNGKGKNIEIKWIKWPFFPIIKNLGNHIISNSLDSILTKFPSSINKIKVKYIKHTPLLISSSFTKRAVFPIKIDLDDLRKNTSTADFNEGEFVIGYLLEGCFQSCFKTFNMPSSFHVDDFIEKGKDTKLIIISCGDLIINDIDPKTNMPIKLGYDFYLNHFHSNQEFILNCLDYLINPNSLIDLKNKNFRFCYYNPKKLQNNFLFIQLFNLVFPLLTLFLFALIMKFFLKLPDSS